MKGWTSSTPAVKRALSLSKSISGDEAKLNRMEKAWLFHLRQRPDMALAYVHAFTLKLGDDCRYTPDFAIICQAGTVTFHEVKGFMRDDAQVKLKVAARMFPHFRFVLVTKEKGIFVETEVTS